MRRIVAGLTLVLLTTLVGAPADAQLSSPPTMTPAAPRPLESDVEVVLTISSRAAGTRFRYMTFDGTCAPPSGNAELHERFNKPPCEPEARAPADYTAVDGEVVFTESGCSTSGCRQAASRTIRIPIVDDDLAEGTEAFTVIAWEEPNGYSTYPYDGPSVIVRINDNETVSTGEAVAPNSTTATGARPSSASAAAGSQRPTSGPPIAATGPTIANSAANPTTAPRQTTDVELALPTEELHPGPGFELTSEEVASPPTQPDGGGSRPASRWRFGLGGATAAVGALAFRQRRRRWSPTQP